MSKSPDGAIDDYVLALLLQKPDLPDLKAVAATFPPECFNRSDDREIFTRWLNVATIEELRHALDTSLHDRLEELTQNSLEPTVLGQSEEALRQALSRLEERHLRSLQDGLLSGGETIEVSGAVEKAIIDVNDRLREIHARRG